MFTDRILPIAQIALIAFFVGWTSFGSSYWGWQPPQAQSQNQGADHARNKTSEGQENKSLWKPNDPVSLYTLVLAFFSGLLVLISGIQIRYLISADETARTSANAAELTAQAAIGVKLPRIMLQKMELFQPGPPYGKEADSFKNIIAGGIPPERTQVSMTFTNIGETAAFLTSFCMQNFIGPRLPQPPVYGIVIPEPAGSIIKADAFAVYNVRNFFVVLTSEQLSNMQRIETSHRLWVYGFIAFTDFLGNPHESRFCQRWQVAPIMGGPTGFVSDSETPPEYTRSH
jgi:hypothetical protein